MPNLKRLVDEISARPAAKRAVALKDKYSFKAEMDDEARRHMFEHLAGKGKIVILEGTAGAPTNRERLRGYKQALSETSGIEVLASTPGNYQQTDGKRVMAGFLKDYPQRIVAAIQQSYERTRQLAAKYFPELQL